MKKNYKSNRIKNCADVTGERYRYISSRRRTKIKCGHTAHLDENNLHNKSIIKCSPIIGGNPSPPGKPPPAKKMQSLKTTERASYIVRRSRLKSTMLRKYQMYDENHIVLINDNTNKDKKK